MVSVRPSTVALAIAFGLMLVPPALTALPGGFSTSASPSAPPVPPPSAALDAAPAAAPATSAGGALQVPPAPVLLALLRGTLAAVNQANVTGNYSVLRDLGAPSFRENYNAAALADRFRAWRDNALDFAAVLLLDAKLSRPPAVGADGVLRLAGYFPTAPLRIGFDLGFEAVGGNWRLATIAVDARPSSDGPTATTPAAHVPPPAASAGTGSASVTVGRKDSSRMPPPAAPAVASVPTQAAPMGTLATASMAASATPSGPVPGSSPPTRVKLVPVRAATDPVLAAGALDTPPAPAGAAAGTPPVAAGSAQNTEGTVAVDKMPASRTAAGKTAAGKTAAASGNSVGKTVAPAATAAATASTATTSTATHRNATTSAAAAPTRPARSEPFAMNAPAPPPFDMNSASGGGLY